MALPDNSTLESVLFGAILDCIWELLSELLVLRRIWTLTSQHFLTGNYICITGFVCLFVFWGKLSAGTTQIIVSGISLKWKQMETFRTLHPTLLVLNHWLSGGETLKSIQSDVTSHRQEHMETGSSEWGEIFSAPEVSSWPVVGEFAGRMLNWRMQWFSYKHTGLECHFSSCVWNSSSFLFVFFSSSGEVFPFDSLLNRATDCKYDCYPCIKKNRALNQILEEF